MNTSYENPSTTDEKTRFASMETEEKKGFFQRINPLKSFLYMLCLSAGLCLFFGLLIAAFYQTLDNYTPKLQQGGAFIGSNPGLGYQPFDKDDPYSSLIWFTHGGLGDWQKIKDNLDDFLEEYEPGYWANAGASQTKCNVDDGEGNITPPREKDEACEFNLEWLSNQGSDIKCISEEHYGYYHGKPCILLKLNRIYGWQPQPYFNFREIQEHPHMPKDLKEHINKTWYDNCDGKYPAEPEVCHPGMSYEQCIGVERQRCPQLNMIWLHCDGETDPDKEAIGSVTYTPWRGYPGHFFPYYNQLGYLQPIVMVQLKNPTPGVLINIQCTAWAKNIEHNAKKMRGSVHIEFLMD